MTCEDWGTTFYDDSLSDSNLTFVDIGEYKDYFKKDMSKLDRNKAILKAWQDGFMQSEIAKFLDLSDAGVSKILRKLKVKP